MDQESSVSYHHAVRALSREGGSERKVRREESRKNSPIERARSLALFGGLRQRPRRPRARPLPSLLKALAPAVELQSVGAEPSMRTRIVIQFTNSATVQNDTVDT